MTDLLLVLLVSGLTFLYGYGVFTGGMDILEKLEEEAGKRRGRSGEFSYGFLLFLVTLVFVVYMIYHMGRILYYMFLLMAVDFTPLQAIFDFGGQLLALDLAWPIRIAFSLGDLFFAFVLWEVFGALAMAYGLWTKGIDDYLLHEDRKTSPTLVDHSLAVLILALSLVIFVYLPLTTGENLTQELFPAFMFSMAMVIGLSVRHVLEEDIDVDVLNWVGAMKLTGYVLLWLSICFVLWHSAGTPASPGDISW